MAYTESMADAPTGKRARGMRGERGFTLVELSIVVAIVAVVSAVSVPNLTDSRRASNEAAAIDALLGIFAAQNIYNFGDGMHAAHGVFVRDLSVLGSEGLIDPILAGGTKSGYAFSAACPGCDDDTAQWVCTAEPLVAESSGNRYFFVDESGVIRASAGDAVTSNDGPIERGPHPAGARTPPEAAEQPTPPCQTQSDLDEFDHGLVDDGADAISRFDALFGAGQALQAALALLGDQNVVAQIVAELDGDSNGQISFAEVLGIDVLAVARAVKAALAIADPGPSIGADGDLTAEFHAYRGALGVALDLGGPTEVPAPPPVPASEQAPDTRAAELLAAMLQPLTGDQQKCTNTLNKDMAKLVGAVHSGVDKCIKAHAKGEVVDLLACLFADPGGKIGKAQNKAPDDHAKRCTGVDKEGVARAPFPFAADPDAQPATALDLVANALQVIYGDDIAGGVANAQTEPARAACQAKVAKVLGKCGSKLASQFVGCAKNAVAVGKEPSVAGAVRSFELDACVGADPKEKIAKACDRGSLGVPGSKIDKVRGALAKSCLGASVDPQLAFPGCGVSDPDAAHACLVAGERCLSCRAIARVNDLTIDCDVFDNAVSDASCQPPGT